MDIKGSDGYWLTGEVKPEWIVISWRMGMVHVDFHRLQVKVMSPLAEVLDKLAVVVDEVVNSIKAARLDGRYRRGSGRIRSFWRVKYTGLGIRSKWYVGMEVDDDHT